MTAENQPMAPGASENPAPDPGEKPDPKPAFDEAAFKAGYGKGAERGRKEGSTFILEKLGLPSDLDEAVARLEEMSRPADQDPKIQDLARAAKKYETELKQLQQRTEVLQRQADEARREKIRTTAARNGIGLDQTDAFLAMYGDQISMSETGSLEVITDVEGSKVAGVVQVEDFVKEILKKRPWLAAPTAHSGSGYSPSGSPSESTANPIAAGYDRRTLAERLRGK